MKAKTVIKSKGTEQKIKIEVTLETDKHTLTRDELKNWKIKMQNEMHAVLMRDGYSACAVVIQ